MGTCVVKLHSLGVSDRRGVKKRRALRSKESVSFTEPTCTSRFPENVPHRLRVLLPWTRNGAAILHSFVLKSAPRRSFNPRLSFSTPKRAPSVPQNPRERFGSAPPSKMGFHRFHVSLEDSTMERTLFNVVRRRRRRRGEPLRSANAKKPPFQPQP